MWEGREGRCHSQGKDSGLCPPPQARQRQGAETPRFWLLDFPCRSQLSCYPLEAAGLGAQGPNAQAECGHSLFPQGTGRPPSWVWECGGGLRTPPARSILHCWPCNFCIQLWVTWGSGLLGAILGGGPCYLVFSRTLPSGSHALCSLACAPLLSPHK